MSKSSGRHRAPSRLSTASLSDVVARSGQPVAKASAILAVSGGLVATVAAPTSAAPLSGVADGNHAAHAAHAAPAAAVHRAAVPVPAVASPAATASVVSPQFGQVGFKGNKAPEPVQEPEAAPVVDRTTTAPSRSTERQSVAEREAEQQAAAEREAEQRAAAEHEAAERAAAEKKAAEERAAAEQAAPAPSSGVLGIAARYVGTPYAYGGTTPAGFDCSGYTSYVFRQVGISLSRTAAGQQAQATPVSNPQPGDLVFFGYPAHHVGIYAGGGMMYDSGRPGVPVSKRAIFYSSGAVTYGRV